MKSQSESKPPKPDMDNLSEPAGVAQPVPDRDIDSAAGRTPDGNNVNEIPEKHPDEVVPRSPADQADPAHRPPSAGGGDVSVDSDGKVHEKPRGSTDETMIPQKSERGGGQ